MTTPGLGSWVGISEEPTWGTPVARTRYFPLLASGDNLGAEITPIKSEHIQDAAYDAALVFAGQQNVKGSLELEMQYDGMLIFMKHAFGHDDAPSGAGPYVYQFTPPSVSAVIGEGLSIEVLRGATQSNSFLYEGCKIEKFTLTVSAQGIAKLSLEFLAEQCTSIAKSSPGTIGDPQLVVMPTGQAGDLCDIDSTARICRGFTFSWTNKYEARFDGASKTTLEPYRSGKPEANLELELEFQDMAEFNDFLATTKVPIIMLVTGSATSEIKITSTDSLLVGGSTPFVNSMGIVTYNPSFELYADIAGATREFIFEITNNDSAIT